ncbi:MAG TPA: NDP-sugar synthase [Candidatus Baltobacteraceae bacterium]|nr:NDP-sugar synthase [Candidatus Baltobacteraceae bacterium]
MQAVILVGGEGTRLRPLTHVTPKPMVPLFGVPFLERTLVRLKEAGITDVILAAGYLPSAITDYFGDGAQLGMKLTYVIEESPLGTAGALKNVADHLTGPFFVLNGDIITDLDLKAMSEYHRQKGGLGVLHLTRVEDPSAFGCVAHEADGRITAFVEKPAPGEEPSNEINAGTYLLEREVLERIPPGPVSIERTTFPQLLSAGERLYAYTTDDYWLDLGRPEQYIQAHRDALDERLNLGLPAGSDAVVKPSFMGKDTFVDPTATVGPYAVLGERDRIEKGASVRDSILWDDVVVGENARVEGAILASGVRVGKGATIGTGSVVGHAVEIDSGALIPPNSRLSSHATANI